MPFSLALHSLLGEREDKAEKRQSPNTDRDPQTQAQSAPIPGSLPGHSPQAPAGRCHTPSAQGPAGYTT